MNLKASPEDLEMVRGYAAAAGLPLVRFLVDAGRLVGEAGGPAAARARLTADANHEVAPPEVILEAASENRPDESPALVEAPEAIAPPAEVALVVIPAPRPSALTASSPQVQNPDTPPPWLAALSQAFIWSSATPRSG